MPMPSEHLAAAEELAAAARALLAQGELEQASHHGDLAALYLQLAHTRMEIIGNSVPAATPAPRLPEWCGVCDGPDLNMRWISVNGADGRQAMKRCPTCNPYGAFGIDPTNPPPRVEEPAAPAS